jgi:flagellar basal-body rod modification protein FlgD
LERQGRAGEKKSEKESEKEAREGKGVMGAMAGLFNQGLTAGQALTGRGATPMAAAASGSSSTASAGSSSATISANDFLTLLVTEMQNQDPTAQSDPNEYINQLVQVNSLEQLIDINQNLSTALGGAGSTPSGSTASHAAGSAAAAPSLTAAGQVGAAGTGTGLAAHKAGAMQGGRQGSPNTAAAISQFANSQFAKSQTAKMASEKKAPGNLSVPEDHKAAHHVAHALDGHSHAAGVLGKLQAGNSKAGK